ncbi:MAG: MFS transporter [Acetobacteraceae bacterium]|nr:MFS transporter [Acetobacteraceae bacterium]
MGWVETSRTSAWRELLASSQYRWYYASTIATVVGDALASVSLTLYLFALTGSPFSLALSISLTAIPWILVNPVAGVLADRFSRGALVCAFHIVTALGLASLVAGGGTGHALAVCFLAGVAAAGSAPARGALLPRILQPHQWSRAFSLNLLAAQGGRMVGAGLAGMVVRVWGAPWAFALAAATSLAAGLMMLRVKAGAGAEHGVRRTARGADLLADLGRGFAWLFRFPPTRTLVILYSLALLAETLPELNTVVYLDRVLGLPTELAGTLVGAISLGALAGALWAVSLESRTARGLPFIAGTLVVGASLAPVAARPGLPATMALWATHGIGLGLMEVAGNTLLAELVPDNWRGRVYSAINTTCTTFMLGWALALGRITESVDVQAVFACGGLVSCLGVGLACALGGAENLKRAGHGGGPQPPTWSMPPRPTTASPS